MEITVSGPTYVGAGRVTSRDLAEELEEPWGGEGGYQGTGAECWASEKSGCEVRGNRGVGMRKPGRMKKSGESSERYRERVRAAHSGPNLVGVQRAGC